MVQKSPSAKITKFKEFVKNHPGLIHEVRHHKRSWQDLYEEWDIFGEDPEIWDAYLPGSEAKKAKGQKAQSGGSEKQASTAKKSQLSLANLFSLLEKVDFDQLQNNLSQFSGALENVQKMMGQFQNKNTSSSNGHAGGPGMQGRPPGPPGYGPYPPHYHNNSNHNSPFPY